MNFSRVIRKLVVLTTLSCAAASAAENLFNITAQPLSEALMQLAQQSNTLIMAPQELVKDRRARGVHGSMSTQEALDKLLEGSGLKASAGKDGSIAIHETADREAAEKGGAASVRMAQTDSSNPSPVAEEGAPKGADEDRKKSSISEIIVTATKRAQNIMDVPISMTAITGEEISRRGLVNSEDYLRGMPGVNQLSLESGLGGQGIVIRGLETSTFIQNFGFGATVSTYFGEIPTTDSGGILGSNVEIKLVDIERVEVLRGPQGTAFGSSSVSGTVRTIPNRPNLERFEGRVEGGYLGTAREGGDSYNMQGVFNAPIIENRLAVRAVGYKYRDAGYYRNIAGSDPTFQARAASLGASAFAINDEHVGTRDVTGGRVSALFQATEDLRLTIGYLRQKSEGDGRPYGNVGAYDQVLFQVAPEHVFRGHSEGGFDTDFEVINAMLEHDFGWGQLLATYSNLKSDTLHAHQLFVANRRNDLTGSGYLPVSQGGPISHGADSGEVRLVTNLEGAWNFLGGVYAEQHDDRYDYTAIWYGTPALNPFLAGARDLGEYIDTRDQSQTAIFGEGSWEFMPGLTLTGGARAYEYKRTVQISGRGLIGSSRQDNRTKKSGTNFRANLSYEPNEVAMLYAGWSQGFRLGKPQPGVPVDLCDVSPRDGFIDGTSTTIESTRSLDSDSIENYEIGGKFTFLDRRLAMTAAVFHMDWENFPAGLRAPAPCNTGYTANAGAARSEGVELQANLQLSRGLRVDLGGSYIDAQLTENVPEQGLLAGDVLPGGPKLNGNAGVQQDLEIAGYPIFLRADATYVGSYYNGFKEVPNSKAGGYTKLDASVGMKLAGFSIHAFVRNLTNEDAFVFRDGFIPSPFYGTRIQPRTVGFRLGYDF